MQALLALLLLVGAVSAAQRQNAAYLSPKASQPHLAVSIKHHRQLADKENISECQKVSFAHGVASGDQQSSAVIIWTRVSTSEDFPQVSPSADDSDNVLIDVSYTVAADKDMKNIVEEGSVVTDGAVDFTVKLDVDGLAADTTYYYKFEACGAESTVGTTKTLPEQDAEVEKLSLAVASCSNYQYGYFHAYQAIADQADNFDALLHLGDYIYEYGGLENDPEGWFYKKSVRFDTTEPAGETVTLSDYRQRYSWYRRDTNLQNAHAALPWIIVPDDHEITNDGYATGAENHQPDSEGDWLTRLDSGFRAWYEWLPVRQQDDGERKIYRDFKWGNLAHLLVTDTRYDERGQQLGGAPSASLDPVGYYEWVGLALENKIMSDEQMEWLTTSLQSTDSQWKVIGNQIPFTDLENPLSSGGSIGFSDQWVGYKASQFELLKALEDLSNVVILTGDIHTSFAFESFNNPLKDGGAYAVEFTGPSITSAGFGEYFQDGLGLDDTFVAGFQETYAADNSWMVAANMLCHGYFSAVFTKGGAEMQYFCVDSIFEPELRSVEMYWDWVVCNGTSTIMPVANATCTL